MSFTSDSTSFAGSSKVAVRDSGVRRRISISTAHGPVPATPGIVRLLFCAASLAMAGLDCAWSQIRDYRVGIKVELVSVFATVQDRSGRLVTGLNQDDFVIYDNNVPQQISQFSREYIPLSVIILLDASSS